MARSDPAVALRVPSQQREHSVSGAATGVADGAEGPRLRLVATRGRLGIELDQPFRLGPVEVRVLELSLPDLRFPVELSGGVSAFKHRRGQLERIEVALSAERLSRWGPPRLRGVLDEATPACLAAPLEDGWLVGIRAEHAALAFEVLVAPLDGDLRLLPVAARGLGLGAAPLGAAPQLLAARALYALTRPYGRLVGGVVVLEAAAVKLSRELLPLAGMRVAASKGVRWSPPRFELSEVLAAAALDAELPALSPRVVSAVELAALVAEAEEAHLAGDLDAARRHYLAALERAPRHPEVSRRIAELDLAVGGRVEAALGTLGEVGSAIDAGGLGGALLAELGERDAAATAFRRAAQLEPYGPLAALLWRRVATVLDAGQEACAALSEAIARAPAWEMLRWERFEQRIVAGDLPGAREDLEQLEASARGAAQRHRVLRRGAERLLGARMLQEAAEVFERALRYAPESVDAVAGLARALRTLGHEKRALELLSRAVALAAARPAQGQPHQVVVDLAWALAEIADDRPAAIAHLRSVPALVPETFEARFLEARWRAEMGDLAGANDALARLGEAAEHALGVLLPPGDPDGRQPDSSGSMLWPALWGEAMIHASRADVAAALASWLEQGARIQELDRADQPAAKRLLSLAVRLQPRNRSICGAFRRVAGAAVFTGAAPDGADERPDRTPPAPVEREPARQDAPRQEEVHVDPLELDPFEMESLDLTLDTTTPPETEGPETVDHARQVERLSEKLRGDPSDMATVRELASALELLGRDHELLALLSARIDEGTPAQRAELVPKREVVLQRLLEAARAEGKRGEAELYALMLGRGTD